MVDDPDQTQQTFLGTPMGILIAHRCLSDDGAPKEAEPVQEQLLLIVGVIDGEAMVGHPNRVGGLLSLLLGERVSLNEPVAATLADPLKALDGRNDRHCGLHRPPSRHGPDSTPGLRTRALPIYDRALNRSCVTLF
ncbi:hypothetical protein GCM10022199_27570 [Marihabitans asiaticum]